MAVIETKRCPACATEQPLTEFHSRIVKGRRYPASWCKACTRLEQATRPGRHLGTVRSTEESTRVSWLRRLRLLGLTEADYDRMLDEQGGRCAICRTDRPGGGRTGRWPIDHDHVTGRVRGLLCHPCNRALGLLRDMPELVDAAAAYLRRFS